MVNESDAIPKLCKLGHRGFHSSTLIAVEQKARCTLPQNTYTSSGIANIVLRDWEIFEQNFPRNIVPTVEHMLLQNAEEKIFTTEYTLLCINF